MIIRAPRQLGLLQGPEFLHTAASPWKEASRLSGKKPKILGYSAMDAVGTDPRCDDGGASTWLSSNPKLGKTAHTSQLQQLKRRVSRAGTCGAYLASSAWHGIQNPDSHFGTCYSAFMLVLRRVTAQRTPKALYVRQLGDGVYPSWRRRHSNHDAHTSVVQCLPVHFWMRSEAWSIASMDRNLARTPLRKTLLMRRKHR